MTLLLKGDAYYVWLCLRKRLVYRSDLLFGWLGTVIMIAITYSIWRSVYSTTNNIGPFDFRKLITYVIVAKLLEQFFESNVEENLGKRLQTGDISIFLVKPRSIPFGLILEAISGIIFNMLFLVFPLSLILLLLLGSSIFLYSPAAWVSFLVSAGLGWGVMFTFQFLLGLLGFFNVRLYALYRLRSGILLLLGGIVVPLSLYPQWALPLVFNLPFMSIFYSPLSLLISTDTSRSSFIYRCLLSVGCNSRQATILEQVVWLAVMVTIAGICWQRSRNALTINGG